MQKIIQTLSPVSDAFLPHGSNDKSSVSGHNVFMKEIWKPVKGFEGLYMVSSIGRVKSLNRFLPKTKRGFREVPEKILKPTVDKVGYFRAKICNDGYQKFYYIHRLVVEAFVGNFYDDKVFVNHIDGNKGNNDYRNLEIVNSSENAKHSYKFLNRIPAHGERNGMTRLTEGKVLQIRKEYSTGIFTMSFLANKFKTTATTIWRIVNKISWNHI